jgi:GTP-binding protein
MSQPDTDLPPIPEVDLARAGLDFDSDDFGTYSYCTDSTAFSSIFESFLTLIFPFFPLPSLTEIMSDPSYPGQWRISGQYIENIAKMTHWEYPEAVARFGRQLEALGIAKELQRRGAMDGDLVMVDEYDFEFNSRMTNLYIPEELLEKEAMLERKSAGGKGDENDVDDDEISWRPFQQGGFLDVDSDELVGFMESDDWDLLDDDFEDDDDFVYTDDEIWTSS